ncbi:DinB family protein [Bacillus sp. RD4P76]|uniref:DinB family protein n=2 Tax=Bacillus suaedaesalsae TaxID=2810349 RepID=A0ABS2DHI6_9BACI|nr:DinB family protein [Bacillus suaedaesalsae]
MVIVMPKQFQLTRDFLLHFVKNVDDSIIDTKPNGFNNNLRWHIGHVLTTGEKFLFGFPTQTTFVPENYKTLFEMGSSPADWNEEDVPSLTVLIEQLEAQTARIRELEADFFEQELPFNFPYFNLKTYDDLFAFMMYHEADHLGQMKAMKKMVLNK